MSNETSQPDAARYLKRISYIKIDLSAFLVITKKPQDAASKQAFLDALGDGIYLPSPESLVAELSSLPAFLQFRNIKKEENHSAANDPSFNRKIASEFVSAMFSILGVNTETDEKMNVYIPKNEVAKLKNSTEGEVKDLYSLMTRSGGGSIRKGNTTQWG